MSCRSRANQARIWLRSKRVWHSHGAPGTRLVLRTGIVVGVLSLYSPMISPSNPDLAIWNVRAAALNPHCFRRVLSTQAAKRFVSDGRLPPLYEITLFRL